MSLVASLIFNTGCVTLDPVPSPPNVSPNSSIVKSQIALSNLVQQTQRLRNLNAAALNAQADTLQKTYLAQKTEENRIKLASFLALAPSPPGDRSRALTLLDQPPGNSGGMGRNHPIALILIPLLQDIRRLEDAQANQSAPQQKLRDEQKRNEALQQKNEDLQQKNDDLQRKLDAFLNIEKQMRERHPITKGR